ncbi:family 78 glycoside hydrolase catalytic domain [Agromyces ramosus]|uniref:alpha-L-rhamnosidase n=1 Tax=Agromyces ramosus TaxID=33879 RepID=A0ABU0R6P5_9MICO|nr:family 78 glycoside hydrolase catalytic domain [Agromyces ramosus]MDQ0893744.1 alpha-L-rhamnosidase [Agromyces ramosus]
MLSNFRSAAVGVVIAGTVFASVISTPPAPALAAAAQSAPVGVGVLETNSAVNPIGIPLETPKLSWQLTSDARGTVQGAYQVRVATSEGGLSAPDVWDSGKVESDASVEVPYGGPDLEGATAYAWQVRVWDGEGQASDWSAPASFETALASVDDWDGADWIGADTSIPTAWTDYTMTFDASKISGSLGVYFRGRDGGNAYMWQLSQSERSLRPHVKTNGGYSVLTPTAFPAGFDFAAEHEYSITVDGRTIVTRVDGAVLDTRTVATHNAPGLVGFRTSGAETGTVSEVKVTAESGDVLLATTFASGDRTFTAGTVQGGNLVVAGDTDAWYAFGSAVPVLRTEFEVDREVESARIYAAARGLYELQLNGEPVGDQQLAPGWTDYRTRILYQTYDVTGQVADGENALGAEIADGWYAGRVAMFGDSIYGSDTSLIAQLRIRYTDGTEQVVATDDGWRTTNGPTTSADLLDGEAYDARRADALGAWSEPGYDDGEWADVVERPTATAKLQPQIDPPVRVTEELDATVLPSPAAGVHVYDLGQNMVGHARVTLTGETGDTVRIRVAEVLNPDGTLYTANFRSAKATDYYTFGADGTATWEPKFTFHGFRYVEITGVDEAPPAEAITGVVVGTDNTPTASLETSSALVNQLQSNIVWGQRGNFLSIPTDTPARDERMGWTGDINVFSNTANVNMDSQLFLTKWLQDLRDTQGADGSFPGVAPIIPGRFDGGYGRAGWADAGVHVPYSIWQAYGDTQVLLDSYDSMKRYVDYLDATAPGHIRNVGGYNDWLNLDDDTPATVIDTAFLAKGTREFAEMAQALGRDDDAQVYFERYEAIKAAFGAAFVGADGTVRGDSQTAYILTIMNDLIPAGLEDQVAAQFVETLERRGNHLSTGFLGVDGLLPALTAIGRTDIAYILLQNTDYPSWGYEIGKGATTIWERWNSIMPDGTFGPVEMNSFNHYAYGAVGEWMYRTMAGVSALEPGYRKALIAPQAGAGIDWVDFSLDTPYGTVASSWRADASGAMRLDVTVPPNTTAEVRIPTSSRWGITEGGIPAESVPGIEFSSFADGVAVFTVGSGEYAFAQDQTLGRIGDARDAASAFGDQVAALTDGGALSAEQSEALTEFAGKFADRAGKTWDAFTDDKGGRDRDLRTAGAAHQALSTIQSITAWLDREVERGVLAGATADVLRAILEPAAANLSVVSATLVGAAASLATPTDAVFPGDVARVAVVLVVSGEKKLSKVEAEVSSSDGWTVTALPRQGKAAFTPGSTTEFAFDVAVPADAEPGRYDLTGSLTYRYGGTEVTLPLSAELAVSAPVAVQSVSIEPAAAHPGDVVVLAVDLVNRTDDERSGAVQVTGPDGWEQAEVPFTLAAGASGRPTVEVTVPYTVTAGDVSLTAAVGSADEERGEASLSVGLSSAPAVVVDHVDLGLAASERSHRLTASEHSGTSAEAGLTRRYTHTSFPGGWFEFDVAVPSGEPFVVRAVETFDGARAKTYDVSADGVTVLEQRYTRTAGGTGTMTYQFLVDDAAITADGTVRLRFQDVDGGYDPSIADVWILPVATGLDAAQNLLAGSAATARTSLQAAPGWGTANLVDGKRESLAGGAKGYTSNPPDRSQTGADQWVAFDLGASKPLNTVVIYPRTATADDTAGDGTDGAHFPKAFAVQVSDDGTTWTTVRQVTGQPDPGPRPQTYTFDTTPARYLRVQVAELGRPTAEEGRIGFYRLQLAEVQAFALG